MFTMIDHQIHSKHVAEKITYPTICVDYEEEKRFHSIFYKANNPFDFLFPVLLAQIILSFLLATGIHFVLRPFKQPKFVSYMLAGIILGPSGLSSNETFLHTIFPAKEMLILNTFATMGITIYIFIMAIKIDTTMLLKTAKTTWIMSLSTYFCPLMINLFFNWIIQEKISDCVGEIPPLYLSSFLSTTYFSIVSHVMEELSLLTTELGQLALASSVLTETISHFATATITIFSWERFSTSTLKAVILAYAPVIFAIYILRPIMMQIVKRTPPGKPVEEKYVISIFLMAFMMVFLANSIWGIYLPMVFLMGLIIPDGPPLGATLVEKSELFLLQFFLPLFFIKVGYSIDLSSIKDLKVAAILLLIVIVSNLGKMLVTLLASLYFNIRFRNGLLLSMILNFRGIMDLVTYERWTRREILSVQCYTILVLFDVTFIAFSCPLIKILYEPRVRLIQSDSTKKSFTTLQSIPQNVELRVLACIHHECNVHGIINILEASSCKSSKSAVSAYVVNVNELVGRAVPLLTHYNSHKRRCKNNNSDHIVRAFKNYSKRSNGFVSITPFTMVAPYKTMHNIVCNLAEDKLVPLIIVPFHTNHEVFGLQSNLLQDFNTQLQENAPCTVGILLDRGLNYPKLRLNKLSYNVVVLFVGGPDDREALSLATRMSNNPNVNITVVRINSKGNKKFTETEKQLDDLRVQEFNDQNANNACAVFHEVIVRDGLEMVDLIKSLENKYDLVMVGKNPTKMQFEKEMVEWIEYPELGVMGDMLASLEDFCDSEMSVLVMQHCKVMYRY